MKKLIYIFLILLGFTSCMREDRVSVIPNANDKVDIVFGVTMPEPTFGTKAMSDTPDIENMYVAVFGGSGFLKEYVKAEIVSADANYDGTDNTKYNYKVSLSLTESTVKIHFIANGPSSLPFRNEDEVMSSLMKNGNDDAYWQKIVVPGIRAKKDEDGNFLDEAGNIINIDQEGVDPIIDPTTKTYFANIPLIRNFARIKVEVEDGIDFVLEGFVLINTPKSGTVAPYNRTTGSFVENYQDKGYNDLFGTYPGNLPVSTEIDGTIIEDKTAYTPFSKYMYERPIPISNPTMAIILGWYDGEEYFYKVDLMDDNGYYPIYRNFEYKIKITQVLRAGAATAKEAVESAGSGDVSTITEAQNLTDVSDGTARIYVEYTEKTIVGQQTVTLKYKFIPKVSTGTVDNSTVTITKPNSNESPCNGDVIGSETDWKPNSTGGEDAEGFRTLSFKTQLPGAGIKTQSIKVMGTYNEGASKLYRIVTFKLMNTMSLEVECVPDEVPRTKGSKLDVVIKLPKDLPSSMFPLQLKIEADKLSITPDNDNLPVKPGTSIVQGSSAASYQFIKTLSKAEYDALISPDEDKVSVPCHFKTSKDISAGTLDTDVCKVYVDNIDADHAYFYKAYGTFTNYDLRHFQRLSLTPLNQTDVDQDVTLKFNLENHSPLPDVYIKLKGLKPADTSWNPVSGTTDTYVYDPGNNTSATIALKTSDDSGVYGVSLSAYHYQDTTLANLNYVSPGFTPAQVPWGINKDVEFKFSFQGTAEDPILEDVRFTLSNLKPADNDGRFELRDGKWIFHPVSGSGLDQTIVFKTIKLAGDVSVSMVGDSYNPAGPIPLTCPDLTYDNPRFTTQTIPLGRDQDVVFAFSYRGTQSDPIKEDVVFTLTNLKPSDGDSRFKELGGNKWLFKPLASSGLSQTITFKTVLFVANVSVEMSGDYYKPSSVSKTSSTNQFTISTSVLTLVGPNKPGQYTQLYIYSFNGDNNNSVGSFYVDYSNSVTITINDNLREDERVYFRYSSGGWSSTTYYSTRTYTLTELYEATSSKKVEVGGFSTTKPTE